MTAPVLETFRLPRHRGSAAPRTGLWPILTFATVLLVLFAIWLVPATIEAGSLTIAAFTLSVISLTCAAAFLFFALIRTDRRRTVLAEISPSEVAFVGLNGTRPIMWWLVASAVVMLISIVVSIVTGEFLDLAALLSGGQERGGIAVFIFIAVMTLIACGMSLMKGNSRRLILTPGGLTLKMNRTGGAAAWSDVVEVVESRRSVSILSSGGRFSFRPRDLDSDSAVLADVIRYYLSNPAQRQSIGAGTAQLLRSGELEAWAVKREPH